MYIRHVDRKCKCNTRSQAELFNYSSAQGYIVKMKLFFNFLRLQLELTIENQIIWETYQSSSTLKVNSIYNHPCVVLITIL